MLRRFHARSTQLSGLPRVFDKLHLPHDDIRAIQWLSSCDARLSDKAASGRLVRVVTLINREVEISEHPLDLHG